MTTAEATEELTDIRAAIKKIVTGGQAYSADGRSMSRADLKALYERERYLEVLLARLARGGAVTYAVPSP